MKVDEARMILTSRAEWEASGATHRAIAAAVRRGRVAAVYPGWFVPSEVWGTATAENRHLLQVVAANSSRRGSDVVSSHVSAAVVWGLPLFRIEPKSVHVSGRGVDGRVRSSESRVRPGTGRHDVAVAPGDRTEVDGIPVTSLERTVFDLLRTAPREAALAVLDAALRRVAWSPSARVYDLIVAEQWRAGLEARIARAAGARGIRQARLLSALGDGRAQLPGESVSRLYLHDLGFAPPRLQVAIPGPAGSDLFVDFGLDDVNAWGEFDGEAKYVDPSMTHGLDALHVLRAEKERQDWIHGTTGRRFVRWGMRHLASSETLGVRLAGFRILAPGRPRRVLGAMPSAAAGSPR